MRFWIIGFTQLQLSASGRKAVIQGSPQYTFFRAALPGDQPVGPRRNTGLVWAVIAAGAFLALVFFSVFAHKVPTMILWCYLAMSMITFLMYAFDKTAAKDGAQRTPENMLHWLSVIGGWPGALIAQQALRHKSKKQSFRIAFWVTVFANCGVFVWLLTPEGSATVAATITLACCTLTLAAIFLFPAPFLHDFTEWVFQGKVLALKLESPEKVAGFALYAYPVPYMLGQYLQALLHLFLPPLIAGKALLALYLVAWCYTGPACRLLWSHCSALYYSSHMPHFSCNLACWYFSEL